MAKHIIESSIILRSFRYAIRKLSERQQERSFAKSTSPERSQLENLLRPLRELSPSRIVVVGNGPSLKLQNLELLRDEFTICTNAFFHAYDDISWRPTILTIEDPLPASDNADFYNADADSVKVVPYDLRKFIKPSKSTAYINFLRSYTHWSSNRWPRFSTNIVCNAFWGGTVSYLALQIAATFEPQEIILIGTDLTYVVPSSAIVSGTVILSTEDDPNHFNPNYFGKGKKWHIPETERMQRAFEYAMNELKTVNIELQNATAGGNLKVVPKIDYGRAFS